MTREIFYPAPQGLPVPVRPPQGDSSILEKILQTNWAEACHLVDGSLVGAGALWLHGFLDESHQIVQKNSSSEASYWHALVHRSEGDFANSMYWFGKVGRHPIYEALRQEVGKLESSSSGPRSPTLLSDPQWNPQQLVDLCKAAYDGKSVDLGFVQRVAAAEYHLLMGFVLDQQAIH